jgi:hypothetical protein
VIASIAFLFAPTSPPPSYVFLLGKALLVNGIESDVDASPRRFRVRDWRPSDGGFQGWIFKNGEWSWHRYPPRWHPGEYFTIIRLEDGAKFVAPRRWWKCCPSGLPRDTDAWAEPAWRRIEDHYREMRPDRFFRYGAPQ